MKIIAAYLICGYVFAMHTEHTDGALLNRYSKFFDPRIGQSTTLCGRQIVKHMSASTNENLTGEYDYYGQAILYGDSVTGDSMIRTNNGTMTIAQLFNESREYCNVGEKEYGLLNPLQVVGFNAHDMEPHVTGISYVMRHKTKKKLYRITTQNGKQVTVTHDHSIMIDRDGQLLEVKPTDLLPDDLIITIE